MNVFPLIVGGGLIAEFIALWDESNSGNSININKEELIKHMIDVRDKRDSALGYPWTNSEKERLASILHEKISYISKNMSTFSKVYPELASINYLMPLDKIKSTLLSHVSNLYGRGNLSDSKIISRESFESIKDEYTFRYTDFLRVSGADFINSKFEEYKLKKGDEKSAHDDDIFTAFKRTDPDFKAPDYRIVTDNTDASFSLELSFRDRSYIFISTVGASIYFKKIDGYPYGNSLSGHPFLRSINFTDLSDTRGNENVRYDELNKVYWLPDTEPKSFNHLLKNTVSSIDPDYKEIIRENFLMRHNLNDGSVVVLDIAQR